MQQDDESFEVQPINKCELRRQQQRLADILFVKETLRGRTTPTSTLVVVRGSPEDVRLQIGGSPSLSHAPI